MMVLRRRTGWEHLANDPVRFFEEVLQLQLSNMQVAQLNAIADGRRTRLGLVWTGELGPHADEATLAVGVALWRAAACHRPTVLWGGRRSIASAWMDHTILIIQASRADFRHDFRMRRGPEPEDTWGLLLPTGAWAIRYDGALPGDARAAAQALGNRVDVLIGDFNWVDGEELTAAFEFADQHDALATLVVGQDGSR